ncbi:SRPBCC family protein [Parageobacillus thermoglucosidasius]|uniref:SRPBCC domain-containing protein n=1 Tax=Parageobacillus thermoglucosidasius TaxID=1426 RepID=A0AB38QW49_PARTM|nr:SRPBCC domain-containing protein [Parageobacillus thermoglucosidasius]UOE74858.1 SRPBCC domain-containing protein [Parageobacillus thermoglucosidasius]
MTAEKNAANGMLPQICHTIVFQAPIQKVWKAVSTSEGLAAWFMPNDLQLVVGYEFHVNAGPFGMSPCKVIEVEPPHRLSFRWGKDWTVTFVLKELNKQQTEFTLIHSGWEANKVTEFGESHTIVRNRMDQGWAKLCQSLGAYVEE